MNDYIIDINTDSGMPLESATDLYTGRGLVAEALQLTIPFKSDVTVLIQGYNGLEKTKQCVENVLKYTDDVDFDLLLIDNGSIDDTFEYFKSVPYEKKRILHLSKNICATFPWSYINLSMISRYLVILSNDIIVTKNWLSNLVKVAESDNRIGLVNPMSSNVSNYQGYDIRFRDFEDMQIKAEKFNQSDPRKWHEKLRIITLGCLIRKECFLSIGLPPNDLGFFHDFGDDDMAFKIRRAGYKVVLARDTWIHHNHAVFSGEGKDPEKFAQSLEVGRRNFNEKYFGIDAWNDVNNSVFDYLPAVKAPTNERPTILGVDVRCGTPILDIRNKLREFDSFDTDCYAYTEDGKYFIDLQTVCGGDNVMCGQVRHIDDYYERACFDYVIVGKEINLYPEPERLMKKLTDLLKEGGQLFVSIKNVQDIASFLMAIGQRGVSSERHAANYSPEEFFCIGEELGCDVEFLGAKSYEPGTIPNDVEEYTREQLSAVTYGSLEENMFRLMSDQFLFCFTKK